MKEAIFLLPKTFLMTNIKLIISFLVTVFFLRPTKGLLGLYGFFLLRNKGADYFVIDIANKIT